MDISLGNRPGVGVRNDDRPVKKDHLDSRFRLVDYRRMGSWEHGVDLIASASSLIATMSSHAPVSLRARPTPLPCIQNWYNLVVPQRVFLVCGLSARYAWPIVSASLPLFDPQSSPVRFYVSTP